MANISQKMNFKSTAYAINDYLSPIFRNSLSENSQ